MDFLLQVIQLYGFPAAMCIWFMMRLEKKLDRLDAVNHKQVVVMAVLVRILGDKKSMGSIPDDFMEEVTGVTEIPILETIKKQIKEKLDE